MNNEHENGNRTGETAVAFKKVIRGFDPDEVIAYIDEMTHTMQDASKNYETRMAEMKQELTLVSRERDNLRKRCSELEENADTDSVPVPQTAEPKEESEDISELKKLKAQLKKERAAAEKSEKNVKSANVKIDSLNSELEKAKDKLAESFKRIDELEKADKTQPLREQYEESLKNIEKLKAEADRLREKNDLLQADTAATAEHIRKIEDENSEIKTELSRITVENDLLREKNGQYKKELSDMKSEAKEKAYSFAERLAAGEDELNKEKMKLEKKLRMQTYHIEQANSAVEELKKQLEQISLSLGE